MDGSIGFSTTQSIGKSPCGSFTFQNKIYKNFGTLHNFFFEKNELQELIKKNLIEYRSCMGFLYTHFIPLQNEPSPILVGPKLGEP